MFTDGFEPNHAYLTAGGEVWYVTEVDPLRINFIILFSHCTAIIGRATWHRPTGSSLRGVKKIT